MLLLRQLALNTLKMALLIQRHTVEAVSYRLAVAPPSVVWLSRHDDQAIKCLNIDQDLQTEPVQVVPLKV